SGMSEAATFAPKKPGGATPMIETARPLMSYGAPMTDGSDPYFSCHVWKLITATGGAPRTSSASVNRRPRHAETPNVWKKLPAADTRPGGDAKLLKEVPGHDPAEP